MLIVIVLAQAKYFFDVHRLHVDADFLVLLVGLFTRLFTLINHCHEIVDKHACPLVCVYKLIAEAPILLLPLNLGQRVVILNHLLVFCLYDLAFHTNGTDESLHGVR